MRDAMPSAAPWPQPSSRISWGTQIQGRFRRCQGRASGSLRSRGDGRDRHRHLGARAGDDKGSRRRATFELIITLSPECASPCTVELRRGPWRRRSSTGRRRMPRSVPREATGPRRSSTIATCATSFFQRIKSRFLADARRPERVRLTCVREPMRNQVSAGRRP